MTADRKVVPMLCAKCLCYRGFVRENKEKPVLCCARSYGAMEVSVPLHCSKFRKRHEYAASVKQIA